MADAEWSLVQYRTPTGPDDEVLAGVLAGGVVHRAPAGWPSTAMALLEVWPAWEDRLRALDVGALQAVDDAELVSPLTHPRKVLCAGANYYSHAEEMGTARPDPAAAPFFFLVPPTTTVVGPHADIPVDDVEDADLDWEVELAVVIAVRCRAVPLERARSVVAGYAVANDLSARGRFPRAGAVFPPFAWDWLAHKGFDSSCPLGPGIVPAWMVPDPQVLSLHLEVNGDVKQKASTADMVAGVDALVSAASQLVTLEPGDVILTGTPAGVGMPRKEFLHIGDRVTARIDGLGCLENRIVASTVSDG